MAAKATAAAYTGAAHREMETTYKNPIIGVCIIVAVLTSTQTARADNSHSPVARAADHFHRQLSHEFSHFIGEIDRFFGDAPRRHLENQSWVRTRLDVNAEQHRSTKVKPDVKFRLVLPESKKRLRLLFSSENRDTRPHTARPLAHLSPTSATNNAAVGLRTIRKPKISGTLNNSGFKFDAAARVNDGRAEVFGRFGAHLKVPLVHNWDFIANNNTTVYSRSEIENSLSLVVERQFQGSHYQLLQASTLLNWREDNRGASALNKIGWYKKTDDSVFVAAELQLSFHTSPDAGQNYFQIGSLGVRFRKTLRQPWLSYEFHPRVIWAENSQYSATYGALFRMEFSF